MRCLLAPAVVLLISTSAQGASLFGDRAIVQAKEALDDGDSAEALLRLQDALEVVPADSRLAVQARFLASLAAIDLGLHERALDYTRGLDRQMPEIRDFVWYARASAHRSLGRWAEAVHYWREIVRRTPGSPLETESSFSLGDAYYALGWLDKAAEQYDRVLEEHKRNDRAATARFNRARVAEQLRDYETAAELYLEIGFRQPLDYFAPEAVRRHEQLSRRRKIPAAGFYDYLGRADRFLSARAIGDARRELEAIEGLATTSSRRRSLAERQARLLYREDRFEEARAAFQTLANQNQGAKRLRFLSWVSRSLASQKRFDEAVDVYEKLSREYRGKSEARSVLYKAAWLAYNGGNHKRSLALFDAFVATYGADHDVDDAQWFIAWNSYRLGEEPVALKALRKLRRDYPRSKLVDRTYYWEARILHRAQRYEEATRAYQGVIDRDPNGYYAVYARQRLTELAEEFAPGQAPSKTLAALGVVRYAATDFQRPGDSQGTPRTAPLSRAYTGKTFDWSSPIGKRALTLMTLGFLGEATDLVRYVPPLPGVDEEQVHFARARLLHSLGDYHAAYRIALVHLRDRVERGYTPSVRGTFEMLYPLAHPELVKAAAKEWGV
ncbi:MAG: tetratricopeptide repeat protein, partial [Myxococcota bacterium]